MEVAFCQKLVATFCCLIFHNVRWNQNYIHYNGFQSNFNSAICLKWRLSWARVKTRLHVISEFHSGQSVSMTKMVFPCHRTVKWHQCIMVNLQYIYMEQPAKGWFITEILLYDCKRQKLPWDIRYINTHSKMAWLFQGWKSKNDKNSELSSNTLS